MIAKKIAIASVALLSIHTAFAATGSTVSSGSVTTSGISSSASSSALDIKTAPRLVSETSTSITLEFDKIATASGYIVKYGTKSVATSTDPNAQYDNESDQISATGTTISGLKPSTQYYFSVVAVDKDGNESDKLSDELAVSTSADSASGMTAAATSVVTAASGTTAPVMAAPTLSGSVNALNSNNLTIKLATPIASGATVVVKVTQTKDTSSLMVASATTDNTDAKKVNVTLTSPLIANTAYTAQVMIGSQTANIDFTTPATLAPSMLNAASASGMTASGALAASGKLPATGTEQNVLILIALIAGLGIAFSFKKKSA